MIEAKNTYDIYIVNNIYMFVSSNAIVLARLGETSRTWCAIKHWEQQDSEHALHDGLTTSSTKTPRSWWLAKTVQLRTSWKLFGHGWLNLFVWHQRSCSWRFWKLGHKLPPGGVFHLLGWQRSYCSSNSVSSTLQIIDPDVLGQYLYIYIYKYKYIYYWNIYAYVIIY